jgi:Uma2 family endonuclease
MAEGESQVRVERAPGVKFTYDDFIHFPDDGRRHEIVDGVHYVTPSPSSKHQIVVGNLFALIWTHLKQHPVGHVFVAPFDVVLSHVDVVEPDLLYIARERLEIVTDKNVRGVPDLMVEVLSPGTRRTDEGAKKTRYELFGVEEYWLVDPERETIVVYRRSGNAFAKMAALAGETYDTLTTPLLPGWSVPLSDVFASPLP